MCGVLVLMIGRLFQQLVQQQGAQKGHLFSNKSNRSEKICNMKVFILIPSEHLKLSYVIKLPMFGCFIKLFYILALDTMQIEMTVSWESDN